MNPISQVTFEVFTDFIWCIVEIHGRSNDKEIHVDLDDFRSYVEERNSAGGQQVEDVRMAELLQSDTMEEILTAYLMNRNLIYEKEPLAIST